MINSGVSDEQFSQFVKDSFTIAGVLRKLNILPKGANYRTVHKRINKLNLDTSHFKAFGWSAGLKRPEFVKDIALYLNNEIPCESHKLKLRLISEGYFERKCYTCNLSEWMNKPIPLELDHIDGNRNNNNLTNLSIICPNCHAQTPNYKNKNRKIIPKKIILCECGNSKNPRSIRCMKCCTNKKTRIKWPNKEELEKLVWQYPMSILSKQLGVSDKSIKKKCNRLKINIPPHGHWLKNINI